MNHVPPQGVSLEEFPESTARSEGMQVLDADFSPRYGTVLLNTVYANKSGMDLHLQVILPPGTPQDEAQSPDSVSFPCLLFVQGSAWHEQQLGKELIALADFAGRGYVIAIVEYRPSDVAPFPAQAEDLQTAVEFVQDHADELFVDPDRIGVWGDSSGGHTVLMEYVSSGVEASGESGGAVLSLQNQPIKCVVDYYGPTNIARMNEEPSIMDHLSVDSPEGMLIGGHSVLDNPTLAAPTIITNWIPPVEERALPPLLIVHGSKDRVVPFAQSVYLSDCLGEKGQEFEFIQLKGADHGGSPFWQPQVLDIVDSFVKAAMQ